MNKRQLEDAQEEFNNKQLADALGLTLDEIEQCNWESSMETSDDGVPYYVLVSFMDDSPKEILEKISGLNDNLAVRVDVNTFETEEPDYDPNVDA